MPPPIHELDIDLSPSPLITELEVKQGIVGKSAYESYLETTSDDPPLTEEEWSGGGRGTGGPSAPTNLSATYTGTNVTIGSSTGTAAILAAATSVNAGVMLAADKAKLDAITGTNTGDQDLSALAVKSANLSDLANAATAFANIKQSATTSATGVVELATNGETNANVAVQGNDTRLSNSRTPTAHTHPSSEISDRAFGYTGGFGRAAVWDWDDAQLLVTATVTNSDPYDWTDITGTLARAGMSGNLPMWSGYFDDGVENAGVTVIWDGARWVMGLSNGTYTGELHGPTNSATPYGEYTGVGTTAGTVELTTDLFLGYPEATDDSVLYESTGYFWMKPSQIGALIDAKVDAVVKPHYIGCSVDGAGSLPALGIKQYVVAKFAGTITAYTIVANGTAPACSWSVWKIPAGTSLPTVANEMIGTGADPFVAGFNVVTQTVNDWNGPGATSMIVSVGDIIGFELASVAVATQVSLTLEVTP